MEDECHVLGRDLRPLVDELLAGLSAQNLPMAVTCASLPDQVRGFGPVKSGRMTIDQPSECLLVTVAATLPTLIQDRQSRRGITIDLLALLPVVVVMVDWTMFASILTTYWLRQAG